MRDIIARLIGLAGLIGITFTWYLWAQFLLGLNAGTAIEVIIGLIGVGFWFVGELALSFFGGLFFGAMLLIQ